MSSGRDGRRRGHFSRRVKLGAVVVVASAGWLVVHPGELRDVAHPQSPPAGPVVPAPAGHRPAPPPVSIAPPPADAHLAPVNLQAAIAAAPTGDAQTPPSLTTGAASTPIADPVISDEGGPVQTAPKIYVLFAGEGWQGGGDPAAPKALDSLLAFYSRLDGSAYAHTLGADYRGAGEHPELVGAWIDSRGVQNGTNPADIVARFISDARIPQAQETSVVVVFPAGTTFDTGDGNEAAGYHGVSTKGVPYTVLSYDANAPDTLTYAGSHEFAEESTDTYGSPDDPRMLRPAFGFGTKPPLSETADVCENTGEVVSGGIGLAPFYDPATQACVVPALGG